jgi:hypothetical protein
MLRLLSVLAAASVVVSCSDCATAKCKEGITFYVADVAGSLARGTEEPLHICFDGTCRDVTITRADAGGSVFVPFDGVAKDIDHDLTVTGAGAMKGEYRGRLASYVQRPNGTACSGSCALATVKIGADGKLTPGIPTPQPTTTAATNAGAGSTTAG